MDWEVVDHNIMLAKEKHRQDVEDKMAKSFASIEFEKNETIGEPDPVGYLERYLNKCLGEL